MKPSIAHGVGIIVLAAVYVAGCKGRTIEEIDAERRGLPAVYLTEKSLQEVRAPADAGMFVDKATGEICYRAYECTIADCPGRSADGQPFLFVHRDVLLSVGAGGEIVREQIPQGQQPREYIASKGGHNWPTCPECLEVRDLENESPEDQRKYQMGSKQYELPEIVTRRKELEEEYQKAYQAREELRRGEGS